MQAASDVRIMPDTSGMLQESYRSSLKRSGERWLQLYGAGGSSDMRGIADGRAMAITALTSDVQVNAHQKVPVTAPRVLR